MESIHWQKKLMIPMSYPVFYSFRRCPYAIRARMALRYAGVTVHLREVVLKQKPKALLDISPKGTVPVLQLENGQVIDESLDIMLWALACSDPDKWLSEKYRSEMKPLIDKNDQHFKPILDHYKYPQQSEKQDPLYYRDQALPFLQGLDDALVQHDWLMGEHMGLADVALFPFLRQFAMVDSNWFWQSSFVNLQIWLKRFLESELFLSVMVKYKPWDGQDELLF